MRELILEVTSSRSSGKRVDNRGRVIGVGRSTPTWGLVAYVGGPFVAGKEGSAPLQAKGLASTAPVLDSHLFA